MYYLNSHEYDLALRKVLIWTHLIIEIILDRNISYSSILTAILSNQKDVQLTENQEMSKNVNFSGVVSDVLFTSE